MPKGGIDCDVTASVSGLRYTRSKTAVHRIPSKIIKYPEWHRNVWAFNVFQNALFQPKTWLEKLRENSLNTILENCKEIEKTVNTHYHVIWKQLLF